MCRSASGEAGLVCQGGVVKHILDPFAGVWWRRLCCELWFVVCDVGIEKRTGPESCGAGSVVFGVKWCVCW